MPVREQMFITLMSIHIFCLSFVECYISFYMLFKTECLSIDTVYTSVYDEFVFCGHARRGSVPHKHGISLTQRSILTHYRHSTFSVVATHVVHVFLLDVCLEHVTLKSGPVSLTFLQESVRRRS